MDIACHPKFSTFQKNVHLGDQHLTDTVDRLSKNILHLRTFAKQPPGATATEREVSVGKLQEKRKNAAVLHHQLKIPRHEERRQHAAGLERDSIQSRSVHDYLDQVLQSLHNNICLDLQVIFQSWPGFRTVITTHNETAQCCSEGWSWWSFLSLVESIMRRTD